MINWFMPKERVRVYQFDEAPFTETQLNASLACAKNNPIWKATLQILSSFCEKAMLDAANGVAENNQARIIANVGGWEQLDSFREELIERREEGLKAMQP